jgi:hypothetical protein
MANLAKYIAVNREVAVEKGNSRLISETRGEKPDPMRKERILKADSTPPRDSSHGGHRET